ncbi:MAG: hypothetical protein NUV78_00210 [Candidatus Zambryskibacteria bacterium]|nr:hypothetical protein [Candidatus Zambryskibacteria bacterium]
MFNPILDQLLERHPLPWEAGSDYPFEIKAKDGVLIAKCMRSDQAQAIINFVERRQAVLDSHILETEKFLNEI